MTDSERIQELTQKIKQLKKKGGDFRTLIRLTALLAYYKKQPIDRIVLCFSISVKSLKRWIKRYEIKGIDFIHDEARSGRPSRLNPEQQELIKKEYKNQINVYGLLVI